jgi:uncharacterized protein (TIGR00251 family)
LADAPPRWFRREPQRLVLSIHVQPGARRSEVAGPHGDSLKIRVQAPATEDRANEALIEFVAQRLGIARRDVTLASGARSREKKLHVPPHCDPARLVGD